MSSSRKTVKPVAAESCMKRRSAVDTANLVMFMMHVPRLVVGPKPRWWLVVRTRIFCGVVSATYVAVDFVVKVSVRTRIW